MKAQLKKKYELTTKVLGPDKDLSPEVRVPNRIPRWTEKGIEYEADPRHAEIKLQQLNIKDAKPLQP